MSVGGTLGSATTELNGGSLDISGELTNGTALNIGGAGEFSVQTGATATTDATTVAAGSTGTTTIDGTLTSATTTIDGGTVNIGGTLDSATTDLNAGSLDISGELINGTALNIGGAGEFTVQTGATATTDATTVAAGSTGTTTIDGTLTSATTTIDGGTVNIGGTLDSATTELNGGSLDISGELTNGTALNIGGAGEFSVQTGASATTDATTVAADSTGTITIAGTLTSATTTIDGGTVNIGGTLDSATTELNGGSLDISGELINGTALNIGGAGEFTVQTGASATTDATTVAAGSTGTTTIDGTLTSATTTIDGGTVNIGGTLDSATTDLNGGSLDISGELINGTALNIGGAGEFTVQTGATATTDATTVAAGSTGTTTIDGTLTSATTTIDGGTVNIGGTLDSATTDLNAGSLDISGELINGTALNIGGAGEFTVQTGATATTTATTLAAGSTGTVDIDGTLSSGNTTVNGGTVNVAGTLDSATTDLNAGSLDISGELINGTALNIGGAGEFTVQTGATATTAATNVAADSTGTITIAGTLDSTATTIDGGTVNIGATGQLESVTVDVGAGAVLAMAGGTLSGATTIADGGQVQGVGSLGTTVNAGTITPGTPGDGLASTLNIDGNFTQQVGGTYRVDLLGDGTSDVISVTGIASIAGTLELLTPSADGDYADGDFWDVITAASVDVGGAVELDFDLAGFLAVGSVAGNAYRVTIEEIDPGCLDPLTGGSVLSLGSDLDCDAGPAVIYESGVNSVVNNANVQGVGAGVRITSADSSTLTNNAGSTITGVGEAAVGVDVTGTGAVTITNRGTISGADAGLAVRMNGEGQQLVLADGSVLNGDVAGGGGDLMLEGINTGAAGNSEDSGFTGIGTLTKQGAGDWTLTGDNEVTAIEVTNGILTFGDTEGGNTQAMTATVNAGELNVASGGKLWIGDWAAVELPTGGLMTVGGTGSLSIAGELQSVETNVDGDGSITVEGGGLLLSLGTNLEGSGMIAIQDGAEMGSAQTNLSGGKLDIQAGGFYGWNPFGPVEALEGAELMAEGGEMTVAGVAYFTEAMLSDESAIEVQSGGGFLVLDLEVEGGKLDVSAASALDEMGEDLAGWTGLWSMSTTLSGGEINVKDGGGMMSMETTISGGTLRIENGGSFNDPEVVADLGGDWEDVSLTMEGGNLIVQTGGSFTAAAGLDISGGQATFGGGDADAVEGVFDVDVGAFTLSGGRVDVVAQGSVRAESALMTDGLFDIAAGGSFDSPTTTVAGGTFTTEAGSTFTAETAFNVQDGTANLGGDAAVGRTTVSGGVLTLDGATLNSPTTQVTGGLLAVNGGGMLSGTLLDVAGGQVDIAGNVNVTDVDLAAAGIINVLGGGSLNAGATTANLAGTMTVNQGGSFDSPTTNVTDGTFTVETGATFTAATRLNVSGGQVTIGGGDGTAVAEVYDANVGAFDLSGGRVDIRDQGSLAADTARFTGGNFGLHSGGRFRVANTLDISGGQVNIDGVADVGGTTTLGNGVNVTVADNGTLDSLGGTTIGNATLLVSGTLSGGDVNINNAGTLNLTDTGTSTVGNIFVNTGGLFVLDGNAGVSTIDINGGTLTGNGNVGTLVNRGIIAPGSSIGTIVVNGNYVHAGSATYLAEINAAGDADLIRANGSITLDGGLLSVIALDGSYTDTRNYLLLQAEDGISGDFARVEINTDQLSYETLLTTNLYWLRVGPIPTVSEQRLTLGLASVATTNNQYQVGTFIDNSSDIASAYVDDYADALFALARLDDNQARYALDSLSGELYGTTQTSLIRTGERFTNVVIAQASAGATSADLAASSAGSAAWGSIRRVVGSAPMQTRSAAGLHPTVIGARWTATAMPAGRTTASAAWPPVSRRASARVPQVSPSATPRPVPYAIGSIAGNTDTDSWHLGLYGSYRFDLGLNLTQAVLAHAWHATSAPPAASGSAAPSSGIASAGLRCHAALRPDRGELRHGGQPLPGAAHARAGLPEAPSGRFPRARGTADSLALRVGGADHREASPRRWACVSIASEIGSTKAGPCSDHSV